MIDKLNNVSQDAAGAILASGGTGWLTLQALTGFANLVLVTVNIISVLVGLWLLWPKIKKRWDGC